MTDTKINWYPGHMARTRRLLGDQLSRIDLVIELCDARLPLSSRNPDLMRMTRGKKHILVLNKADLASAASTEVWLEAFREEGISVTAMNAGRIQAKELQHLIEKATEDLSRRARERGYLKTLKAMVVGVPNVGKSTFINRLNGKKIAQTGDRPGVTRNQQWIKVGQYLDVLDTPGLLWPRLDDQQAARRLSYLGTIRDDILNLDELTISLLDELMIRSPEQLMQRMHIEDGTVRGLALLDAACRGRGWLLKGNEMDYDRACRVILDEFREGKIGRITLEMPRISEAGEGAEKRE